MPRYWGAAVAQRYSGEIEKINEIKRTRVRSPPRATSLKKCHATSVSFKNLPIVNYHPMGENSPNLVTLTARILCCSCWLA
jgi:hypothetical protein